MKTTNLISMKSIYILAAFLGLNYNTIFAAVNVSESNDVSNETTLGIAATVLAPVTPAEATFEDAVEVNSTTINLSVLAPSVPKIADFSDGAPSTEMSRINLAPVTPKEADFEDESEINTATTVQDLAPATPATADFENLD
jgi:hypothetical protein